MSRAFLYGRHSTAKQDMTEDVQQDLCIRYYEKELRPKGVGLARWFYDPAVSSEILFGERNEGRVVLASLQPGDHLIVAKMARAFRSVRDGENTLHQLKLRKVTVHSIDMQVDTSRAHGRFVRRVHMAADQLWREVAAEATQEVIEYRKAEGLPYSKGIPVGWKVFGKAPHRTFRVDSQERLLAEHIASMRASGMSLESLALWGLRQAQFPNKRAFGHRDGVKWLLNARALGYPKVCGYKAVRRLVRLASGQA